MSRGSYMPDTKAQQIAWAQTFVNVVGADAASYGVPAADMTAFSALNNQLQVAWTASQEKSTRTQVTIQLRDALLKQMKASARNLVSLIQGTTTCTDAMKIAAGVTVRKTHGTSVPKPTQKPFIKVKKIDGRDVTIELCQDASKRSKPAGVASATIFMASGSTMPAAMEEWTFVSNTSKTTMTIPFPPSETGDTVYLTAQWTNAKEETGPAANPVTINLPAGGMLPSEENEMPKLKAA